MPIPSSSIATTHNPVLERALHAKLKRRSEGAGSLGELEPLAVRIGLIQNTLKPRFRSPHMVFFAADHGLVVEGVDTGTLLQTDEWITRLLASQLAVSVLARIHGLELTVVDSGMASRLASHPKLQARKIAHGTRNACITSAMSMENAHAAIRAGMEIADALPGNVVACAGLGVGSEESAALVLSQLTQATLSEFLPENDPESKLMTALKRAQIRHSGLNDPVAVLAAVGGFEIAMMVGLMLIAASKRQLILVDGMPACAALSVAARIAPTVADYCVFSRSHNKAGLSVAMSLLQTAALLELGMQCTDGTGACLAWPLVFSAAALLTEVAEGEEAGPTLPGALDFPDLDVSHWSAQA
jgi:nicotinate-nucleotide--dimethylbenzimidazole phosphoribosyltransferase